MKVETHELVPYTLFRRQLGQVIANLRGKGTKIVVTKYGEPAFVVLTVDEYERLRD